jgi:hypothetical protein
MIASRVRNGWKFNETAGGEPRRFYLPASSAPPFSSIGRRARPSPAPA